MGIFQSDASSDIARSSKSCSPRIAHNLPATSATSNPRINISTAAGKSCGFATEGKHGSKINYSYVGCALRTLLQLVACQTIFCASHSMDA